jgi:EpsI family protein
MRRLSTVTPWLPALFLALGCALLLLSRQQHPVPLTAPLSELSVTQPGYIGQDIPISAEEQRIAGMSTFLLRLYADSSAARAFSVYVGYYEEQVQGRSIHSPKNCLPGAGWEPLSAGIAEITIPGRVVRVNRYLIGKEAEKALVYYWYQGRGRVQANEYAVKWDLLRDKATTGRSDEALVRIVVPLRSGDTAEADRLATSIGAELIPQLERRLPSFAGRTLSAAAAPDQRLTSTQGTTP